MYDLIESCSSIPSYSLGVVTRETEQKLRVAVRARLGNCGESYAIHSLLAMMARLLHHWSNFHVYTRTYL